MVIVDPGPDNDEHIGRIAELGKNGVLPHEFGIFVRSATQLDRARAAVERSRSCLSARRRSD